MAQKSDILALIMSSAVVYVHGKGGNAEEREHYIPLFPYSEVIGFDYHSSTPWEAKTEFPAFFEEVFKRHERVSLIALSIGAYFSMCSLSSFNFEKAWFISPICDMEKLIGNMMTWAGVSESELAQKGEIPTAFGETLSWKYLTFVREDPIYWKTDTSILYGETDALTQYETVRAFSERTGATLTVMKGGEHWFHTEEEMAFLDKWLLSGR